MMKKLDYIILKTKIHGEIIMASENEEDLKIYKDNPDYNPNPLESQNNNLQTWKNLQNTIGK